MSAAELYQQTVWSMPAMERLRLASLILREPAPAEPLVDEGDEWSDEDLADLTRASLSHISAQLALG
jgi:hypothetical protein